MYRKTREIRETMPFADELFALADLAGKGLSHEHATELLMEAGRFESGLADAFFPERDGICEESSALRSASLAAGRLFCASWEGRRDEAGKWAALFNEMLSEALRTGLPERMETRIPEGYAHYGLFPEVYLASARDFFMDRGRCHVVCIGLRSIGASLSSIVSAALESLGCQTVSFTLRPRGHPFKRKAVLTPELEEIVSCLRGSVFIIADEGPGLSGSSFSSVAQKLKSLGVPDNNVVFFPSWIPDGSSFLSKAAREGWGNHPKYASFFENVWLESGRLEKEARLESAPMDISAGMWRGLFYKDGQDEADYPAAHPRHERRKYLGRGAGGKTLMLKFAGHGRYGASKLGRAALLAGEGFTPPVSGFTNGFVIHEFISGRPVTERELNQLLIDEMARYSAFLKRNFPAGERMSFEEFHCMAARNIALGLGEDWARKAAPLERMCGVYEGFEPVKLDGRMFPFEWIITAKGYRKTDCLDHHLDQFFPACQDIAWDLAMAAVEFEMNPMELNYMLSRYAAASGDTVDNERFRLHLIAYLAFRLGYSSFASEELAATPEGPRFRSLAHRYASRLKRELLWLSD
ncbi:MAG: hypothetical protein H3C68_03775 [Deltaproteobacteria bacterium]|nr:hypothetical protein [Deltaproteobacteria bacterium]